MSLYSVYVFSHYINIIIIGQKLPCPTKFQPYLLDRPIGVFQTKVGKQLWYIISFFQAIMNRKLVWLKIASTHSLVGFA
jgi:hypothetical protein